MVGKDGIGIIARVCTYLSKKEINILDISQTIVDSYFNMMMIVDIQNMNDSINHVQDELIKSGNKLRVDIKMQHTCIFKSMHRI